MLRAESAGNFQFSAFHQRIQAMLKGTGDRGRMSHKGYTLAFERSTQGSAAYESIDAQLNHESGL